MRQKAALQGECGVAFVPVPASVVDADGRPGGQFHGEVAGVLVEGARVVDPQKGQGPQDTAVRAQGDGQVGMGTGRVQYVGVRPAAEASEGFGCQARHQDRAARGDTLGDQTVCGVYGRLADGVGGAGGLGRRARGDGQRAEGHIAPIVRQGGVGGGDDDVEDVDCCHVGEAVHRDVREYVRDAL